MKPKRIFRRWQQRRQRLQAALRGLVKQCRRSGNAEQVHELRVNLRRLRLFVRVGRSLLDPRAVAQFRQWAHGVSKLTSPVRDLDVAIEWLRNQPNAFVLAKICRRSRDRQWRKARCRLRPPPESVLSELGKVLGGPEAPARLAKRVRKLERRHGAVVRAVLPGFFGLSANDRHEFRRTLRWWRYLRELGLARGEHSRDKLLRALVAAQEATGDQQNLALARAALVRHGKGVSGTELRRQLRLEEAQQADRIREALAALARRRGWTK